MLQLDVEGKLNLTIEDFIGSRCAVLGVSGSGKSMTARVLLEELLPSIPMTLVDIEGELWSLKERFDLLHVGGNYHTESDLLVAPEDAGKLATWVWQNNVSVILDMSEFDDAERDQFLLNYFEALWSAANALPKPHTILIEEAHEFVPEQRNSPLKELFNRYAKRGRKRGIGMIYVSQRSAEMAKPILSQATIFFLHHVADPTDMSVYTKRLTMLPAKQVPQKVSELKSGDCMVIHHGQVDRVHIRLSQTHHVGATPTGASTQIELKRIDVGMLEQLRGALSAYMPPDVIIGKTVPTVRVHDQALESAGIWQERFEEAERQLEQKRLQFQKDYAEQQAQLEDARHQIAELSRALTKGQLKSETMGSSTVVLPPIKLISDGPISDAARKRLADAKQREEDAQRLRFDKFVNQVTELAPMTREVLYHLAASPAEKWTVAQCASRLVYSEGRAGKSLRALYQLGLLRRDNPNCYQANVRKHLSERYPALNLDQLEERLLSAVRPRERARA